MLRFATFLTTLLLAGSTALGLPHHPLQRNTLFSRAPGRSTGCSTDISPEKFAKFEAEYASIRDGARAGPRGWPDAEIEVYWHVVVVNKTYEGGWISPEQLAMQMAQLNADYSSTGLSFNAKLVTRIINPTWFRELVHSVVDTSLQDSLKNKYRTGGAGTLNIYTVGFVNDPTLGYSTFPQDYADNPKDDGVVIRYSTTPGGFAPYDMGRTLTHETGHWLGLFHPFQGGSCTGAGDGVDDTPPQKEQTFGCPARKDTCPGGGADLINNFMDYSDDNCLDSFTPGQIERMRTFASHYRKIGVPNGSGRPPRPPRS